MKICFVCCLKLSPRTKRPSHSTIKILRETLGLEINPDFICLDCLRICKDFHEFKVECQQKKEETPAEVRIKQESGEYFELKMENVDKCWICFNFEEKLCTLRKEFVQQNAVKVFFPEVQVEDDEAQICTKCQLKILAFNIFYQNFKENRSKFNNQVQKKLICEYCSQEFSSISNLKQHFRGFHGKIIKKPFKRPKNHECFDCQEVFQLLSKLKEHVDTVHNSDGFRCFYCPETFKSQNQRHVHIQSAHMTDDFQCKHCKTRFIFERKFLKHMKSEVCKKPGFYSTHLTKNPATPARKALNQFPCDICGERLSTESGLMRHKNSLHSSKISRYFCIKCHLLLKRRDKLKTHTNRCQGPEKDQKLEKIDEFLCEKCDKPFPILKEAIEHQKLCNYERQEGGKISILTPEEKQMIKDNGMQLITGRYGCLTCGKDFTTHKIYTQHFRIYHIKTEFMYCDCCGLKFRMKSALRAHLKDKAEQRWRSETGELVKCEICDATFLIEKNLKAHIRSNHELPERCPVCGLYVLSMGKHMRMNHVYQEVPIKVENLETEEILD